MESVAPVPCIIDVEQLWDLSKKRTTHIHWHQLRTFTHSNQTTSQLVASSQEAKGNRGIAP